MSNNVAFKTAGGRITCTQCEAQSKRTKQQCQAPAAKGKTKCRFHGGLSTGPRTLEGRQRCAQVRTAHGQETTAMRKERSLASSRLALLESIGLSIGLLKGTKTRGRKPDRMGEAYPELQALYQKLVIERAKHSA